MLDQGVNTVSGYPGGAVLPIYDAMFKQDKLGLSSCVTSRALGVPRRAIRSTGEVGAACW